MECGTSGCPFCEGCHLLHYVPGGLEVVTQILGSNPAFPSTGRNPIVPPSFVDGSSPSTVKTRLCNKCNIPIISSHHKDPRGLGGHMGGCRLGGRMDLPVPGGLGATASFGASATAKISVDACLAGAYREKQRVKLFKTDHESDPNLRNIELEGTFDQIKQASAMVQELIVNISSASGHPMKNPAASGSSPNFAKGSCTFGERCHFAHGAKELHKPRV
ncbi:hypothetical protein NMG60_11025867 [Bertholletia excelsa]